MTVRHSRINDIDTVISDKPIANCAGKLAAYWITQLWRPRHVFGERTKKGLRPFDVSPLLLNGEGEIRTPGRFDPTPVFKTGAIGHSATSPEHLFRPFFPTTKHTVPDGSSEPVKALQPVSEHARGVAAACQQGLPQLDGCFREADANIRHQG